ncbi:hypothetical protein [Alkalilacustris brevis]|uniref:hypothetical protein n=1 Tax=Alkalilacustris brevis TaxID=2026338 RepID=UPI000E0D8EE6|nr:hypothetical protein [Alkalilacustris brevis]
MSDIGNTGLTLHMILLATAFPSLVAGLAMWRAWISRAHARFWAVLALVFALLPLVFIFGGTSPGGVGARYMAMLDNASFQYGWLAFALPMSIPLAISGLARGSAARWIDGLHVLALLALATLWKLGL